MSAPSNNGQDLPKVSTDSLGVENRKFVEKVRSMSSAEIVSYLVTAGVNTKDGKLTKEYRD